MLANKIILVGPAEGEISFVPEVSGFFLKKQTLSILGHIPAHLPLVV